jgi:hypothetical protein
MQQKKFWALKYEMCISVSFSSSAAGFFLRGEAIDLQKSERIM